jgi:ABC-2 type transport system permease protein
MLLPWWSVVLMLLPVSLGAAIAATAPTVAQRLDYARVSRANGTFTALYGPLYDASLGGLTAWRCGFFPVVLALFSALTVIRHTRAEEESGRRELLGSAVVGRHAPLAAALAVTLAANLVGAAVVTLTMLRWGQPLAGSIAFGLELAAAGWVFAGVGAVAAQLTAGSGSARGVASSALGVSYLVRVIGDADGSVSWLSWLSPIAWSHEVRAYAGDRWWVLLVPLAVTVLCSLVAPVLASRRDLGAGLLPPRLGPQVAPAGLGTPFGLAWRLQRTSLAAWLTGLALVGLVFGSLAESIADILRDNPSMQDIFARLGGRHALVDSYLAAALGLLGLMACGQAVQAALRMRTEETQGRAEPVLGTAVGRWAWVGGHLPFVLLGPAVSLAIAGALTGLAYGGHTTDLSGQVGRCLGGALLQVPAVWVVAGVALALFGLLPRLTVALGWGTVALCVAVGLFGRLLNLGQWLLDVSPFTHVPRYPGDTVSAVPVVVLAAVAVLLGAAGLAGLRRRDIPVG